MCIYKILFSLEDMFPLTLRQRERERNIEVRGKHRCILHAPTRNQTLDLGMCPDQELNQQPFSVWNDALTN